ncbi:hypothetical protein HZY97_09240 [Sphingomonas sp. R-74633]|uniref:hypothetical protein n=1 Tax=Sphingomonas sp. R-74633 TaxID=2751188 RepID=UPI0015D33C6E|nr:hypothetical protein [Sphingomonas sp. R-74633]NYT40937.1 hypothetical protein [Sphingomonas sp. R-74633]
MISFSFVGFIDILGFSDLVIRDCESAAPGEMHLPSLKSAIHAALAIAEAAEARISQFSDSIVVAAPFYPEAGKLEQFLVLSKELQANLFKAGILCRGGVSHGRHFHDETILFSQGLIEAYQLESAVARNPRIIISLDTLDLIYPSGKISDILLLDDDGLPFIDFASGISEAELNDIMLKFRPMLKTENASIRSKIAWLFRYINFCFPAIDLPEEIQMRTAV